MVAPSTKDLPINLVKLSNKLKTKLHSTIPRSMHLKILRYSKQPTVVSRRRLLILTKPDFKSGNDAINKTHNNVERVVVKSAAVITFFTLHYSAFTRWYMRNMNEMLHFNVLFPPL